MSAIRFYTDVHIPKEAVHQLREKGIDVIHCGDVGNADLDDLAHLEYASQVGCVMVSCDEGFERYHAQWQAQGKAHAGIIWFRMKDQCQSISIVVREILFLHEAADYATDLYNPGVEGTGMTHSVIIPINYIERKPNSDKYRIVGKGVTVEFLSTLLNHPEWPVERICENYNLTPAEVHAAWAFYYDHQREIDERLEAEAAHHSAIDEETQVRRDALKQRYLERTGKA